MPGTAALLLIAIIGALTSGLYFGPMLQRGEVVPLAWWPCIFMATGAIAVVGWKVRGKRDAIAMAVWTCTGSWLCVLLLCGIAGQAMPALWPSTIQPPPAGPREPLATHSALDLFWGQSRALAALDRGFEVDRLDVLSSSSLSTHRRLLLAQPRLLTPQELVALDQWMREGGRAVILADPLLIWPSDLAPGDRRRPPVTSLLDPLLTHWGLRLEPALSPAVQRRFVEGGRLLIMAGASRFTITHSPFARCHMEGDGWAATCRIGSGRVLLIADADLMDERLWLSADGQSMMADTMVLLDQWLRTPLASAQGWPGAPHWVRSDRDVTIGLRWALIAGMLWAILGALMLAAWEKRGRAGSRDPSKATQYKNEEQV